jgi:hypothetical protein
MTSFGTGMLYMMADADLAEGPEGPAVTWLTDIAALGLSRRFRETVGGRVAEFAWDGGEMSVRWLGDEEAAPILEAGGDWGDTRRDWPSALDATLHLPNCTVDGEQTVEADGHDLDGAYIVPIEQTIADLRERLAMKDEEELEDREFLETEVLERLKFCRAHDLIFIVY